MNCASCDVELTDSHLVVDGRPYCCLGCAQGGPCICTYEGDSGRYPRNGHAAPILAFDLPEELS